MTHYQLVKWDGRIKIALNVEYRNLNPSISNLSNYKFFTILPYINPKDSNNNFESNYLIYNLPNSTEQTNLIPFIHNPNTEEVRWKKVIDEEIFYYKINNLYSFFSMFSYITDYDLKDKINILNLATYFRKNIVAENLIFLLNHVPVTVIFVPVGSKGVSYTSPTTILSNIFENTNFLEDHDFYLELGLRYSNNNRIDYYSIAQSILNYTITQCIKNDVMCILDSSPLSLLENTSNNDYRIVKNSNWLVNKDFILAPSTFYAFNLYDNEKRRRRFASIVNKKHTDFISYKTTNTLDSDRLNSIIDETINLNRDTNVINRHYGYPVFVTDITAYNEKNMLRQENAVRAALYAKKVVKNVGKFFLGLKRDNFDYEKLEKTINNVLRNDDINIYAKVSEEENVLDNTIIVRLFVEVGVSIYTVNVELVAQD